MLSAVEATSTISEDCLQYVNYPNLVYSHYTGQPALASTSRSTLLVPRFTARMPLLVATSTLHLD